MTLYDTDEANYDNEYDAWRDDGGRGCPPRKWRGYRSRTLDNRTSRYGDDTDRADEDDATPTDDEGGE